VQKLSRRGSRSGKSKKGNGYSKDGIEFHKTPFYAATVTDLLWFAQVGRAETQVECWTMTERFTVGGSAHEPTLPR